LQEYDKNHLNGLAYQKALKRWNLDGKTGAKPEVEDEMIGNDTTQVYFIEHHLLFIYHGGIQKYDLQDPLAGWVYVDGA